MQQQSAQRIKSHLAHQFNLPVEQIEMMMPSFIATLNKHMDVLAQAIDSGNSETIGRAAHTIKGAFLNLGMSECAAVAVRIEQLGKSHNEDADEYQKCYEELRVGVLPVVQDA